MAKSKKPIYSPDGYFFQQVQGQRQFETKSPLQYDPAMSMFPTEQKRQSFDLSFSKKELRPLAKYLQGAEVCFPQPSFIIANSL